MGDKKKETLEDMEETANISFMALQCTNSLKIIDTSFQGFNKSKKSLSSTSWKGITFQSW